MLRAWVDQGCPCHSSCTGIYHITLLPLPYEPPFHDPHTMHAAKHAPFSSLSASHVAPAASGVKQKNEIFVDILERLNVLFSPNGYIVNSAIDGCARYPEVYIY